MVRNNNFALFSFIFHFILVTVTEIILRNGVTIKPSMVAAFAFRSLHPNSKTRHAFQVRHDNLYTPRSSARRKIIRFIAANINRDETKASKKRHVKNTNVNQYGPFIDGHHRQNGTTSAKLFETSSLRSSPSIEITKEQVKDYHKQKVALKPTLKSLLVREPTVELSNNLEGNSQSSAQWEQTSQKLLPVCAIATFVAGGISLSNEYGFNVADAAAAIEQFTVNPQQALSDVVSMVENLGPLGPIFYGVFYTIAELLAVPATPLTMSAGYLFGLVQGVAVVLAAGVTAASISFFIGRTFLRSYVETHILKDNPKLARIDKAIGEEQNGFKLLLLLRLSPLFPFALSNYVYGASSIDFPSYFFATLLGFIPGTVALIYTGMIGKELTAVATGEEGHPIALYAVGLVAVLIFMKLISDVATNILSALDDE